MEESWHTCEAYVTILLLLGKMSRTLKILYVSICSLYKKCYEIFKHLHCNPTMQHENGVTWSLILFLKFEVSSKSITYKMQQYQKYII